jgi:hypothetical protein
MLSELYEAACIVRGVSARVVTEVRSYERRDLNLVGRGKKPSETETLHSQWQLNE